MHAKKWFALVAPLCLISVVPGLAWAQDTADLPVPPEGFDRRKDGVPQGMVTLVNYPTRNNGMMPARVYTPPGYAEDKQYPTLYLLHGIGGDENEWYNQGAPHIILDNLLAEDKVKPMVLVLPRAKVRDDFPAFEAVLINDLIPYIENNYAVVKASTGRGLAGLSMGGGQTLAFGFGNVDVFTHMGIFSPAPNSPTPPANAFTDLEATKRDVKFIYLSCGTVEQPYRGTCENYDKYMNDQGIEHMFQLEEGLDHNFTNWKRGLYNFSQRIFADTDPGTGGTGGTGGMGGGDAGGGGMGGGAVGTGAGSGGGPATGGGQPQSSSASTGNPTTGGTDTDTPVPEGDSSGCAFSFTTRESPWSLSFALALAGLGVSRVRARRKRD